jgi:hypothetical protein
MESCLSREAERNLTPEAQLCRPGAVPAFLRQSNDADSEPLPMMPHLAVKLGDERIRIFDLGY